MHEGKRGQGCGVTKKGVEHVLFDDPMEVVKGDGVQRGL